MTEIMYELGDMKYSERFYLNVMVDVCPGGNQALHIYVVCVCAYVCFL